MTLIQQALQDTHKLSHQASSESQESADLDPFCTVNAVAPGSPADAAGLKRGDRVLAFGDIDSSRPDALKRIAEMVPLHEYKVIKVRVIRSNQKVLLTLTPQPWEGRGLLGCHLLPI